MSDFRSRESGRLQIDPCEINLQIKRPLPNVGEEHGVLGSRRVDGPAAEAGGE
jgi:hypothetical protein